MDYVVGSVAALITGNVTPNRPRLLKRALTPTKHQPSPNVTPKSEFVEDRSIFLSPTMQKKKAIVKKSPKRIFQNPDLETTDSNECNVSITSPKADKVKKHLKDELGDDNANKSVSIQKSPKKKGTNKRESTAAEESNKSASEKELNESTPKKKKKKQNSESEITVNVSEPMDSVSTEPATAIIKSPKKMKQRRKSVADTDINKENNTSEKVNIPESPSSINKNLNRQKSKVNETPKEQTGITEPGNVKSPKKKNKRRKKKSKTPATVENVDEKQVSDETENKENIVKENQVPKKKNKKRKKSKGPQNKPEIMVTDEQKIVETQTENESETSKSKSTVNPNAVTDKESDSEHESDDEIESENEEINKKVLEAEKPEESSDEEEAEKVEKKKVEKKEDSGVEKSTEEEIQRTLFVGNVLFTAKCKKEIKKIFSKHGQIETIRIRTVPIKDGRYTPKLALIKNELHPERTTVNVYIKYADADSVDKALVENNTLLNEHHLRVSRSSSTGAEHDPRSSVFIGNLPFAMEDEALRAKFEKCGEIHSVRIIRDKKTNAGKGFGYVNFESKDAVELALALTEEDLTVKNRILRVKRCTQVTNKKKPPPSSNKQQGGGFRRDNNQGHQQRGGFRNENNQGNQQRGGFRGDKNQGYQQKGGFRSDNNQDNQQRGGFRGGNNQVNQQRSGFPSRNNQGNRQRNAFATGNNQNQQRGGFNKFANQRNQPQKDEEGREGAHRRVMNKRKYQDAAGGDGPPNKIHKDNQPNKEKKSRKEFVGMTAEKKKKHKFDKGQKKKKALSEILTK